MVRQLDDSAMSGLSLAVEGLGFVYPDGTRALTDVTFSIAPGERVAIIGQNGSGKSTLVRHFNGLLRATEGRVLVGARDVARRHVAELARSVGISFQNPDRQIFSARVRSEVGFGARNVGVRGTQLDERVADALRQVGLVEQADTNPYDLGYSQRKLLAQASILAMATPAVILDEPTTGQDLHGIERVIAIVAALAAEGRTVVAISHDMRFVAEVFERVLVMRDGRLVLDGPTGQVFSAANWPTLESTYLEPPLPAQLGARLGLGPTPSDATFVAALAAGHRRDQGETASGTS
jgi:energy-coupling factor transport system ATP-binding protein